MLEKSDYKRLQSVSSPILQRQIEENKKVIADYFLNDG